LTDIRVLIVEDDPRIADLHRRFTAKVPGFEVVGLASDYTEAVEQAEVLEPELVLLDLYLPQGNGLELLQQLRAEGRQVDVILITAAREADTLQNALRGGVFDYIIKPVVFARFEESLQKYAAFRLRLTEDAALEQADVGHLLHGRGAGHSTPQSEVPKGIDPLTLEKVQAVFPTAKSPALSAEAVGLALGVSRSTARRYLEYLVSAGFLEADVQYGTVGRPERQYQRCRS
jgi:two-component system CitB family response regulator/two-component system response regulator DcuR